jgi:S-adenosylmethionine:tRNA ribosyltransferase-isomerase
MKLSQFDFELPKEKIALYPSKQRDECKLMVVHRKSGKIEHKIFKNVLGYFDDGDVMVLNNTKVFLQECMVQKKKLVLK